MNLTALALLGLSTGLGQIPTPPAAPPTPQLIVTAKKTFPIGFDVKPGRQAEIRSLQLWYSRDRGGVWEIMDSVPPDKPTLTFKERGEGEYWLNMVIQHTDGKLDPPDVSQVVPYQKLVIDTTPPVVTVASATRAGEDIAVEWAVDDKNPNDRATAVYVRPAGAADAQWQMAPPETVAKRSARFKTTIPGAVVVMVVTADLARNSASGSKEITAVTAAQYTPQPPAPVPGQTPVPKVEVLRNDGPLPAPGETLPVTPPAIGGGPATPTQPLGGLPAEPGPGPVQPAQPIQQPPPLSAQPPAGQPGAGEPQPLRTVGQGGPDVLPAPQPGQGFRPAVAAQPVELPPVQVIRSTRFELNYQVDGGISGVSKVLLYVTRDDGRSWVQWSVHDGKESPLKVVLDNPHIHRDLRDAEGDYGFKLVPVSGAGLSDPAPTPGTAPETKVHVDLTAPTLDIYPPQADSTNRNALLLVWKAADKNFGRDPILIEYGETVNGPWKSVAAGDVPGGSGRLANTGSYSWSLPAGLTAPSVYLRVTAWDLGGNKTERVTERPVLVDLTRPRAKIQSVVVPQTNR
jgi:hypothetical protein